MRLAGPVHDGDHVFLRQLDQPDVVTLPLKATCHRIEPTNFGLDSPTVGVAARSCSPGAKANLKVTVANPNDVDRRLENLGIDQIDYTVLLVRSDGVLAGSDPAGTLVSFDEPSSSEVTLSQAVPKPATYQVRVIGLDGAVVSSANIRLSCAGTGGPGSSSTARPTPTVPTSPPKTTSPSTSRPAPSTSRPSAGSSSTGAEYAGQHTDRSLAPAPPASSPARSAVAGASSTPSAVPTRSTPVRVVTSGVGGRPPPRRRRAGPVQPACRAAPRRRPASLGAVAASDPDPAPSPTATGHPAGGTALRLPRRAGLPEGHRAGAAGLLRAAMAALVGSSVVAARRR